MKLFNYLRMLGSFTDAYQLIALNEDTTDRQEKKMLAEANDLLVRGWARRREWLEKQAIRGDEPIDMEAEKLAFFPKKDGSTIFMPLQYIQDYMVRKMAAVQNNVSIHNKAEVAELLEIFKENTVELTSTFSALTFDRIVWSAKPGQKPKLMLHAHSGPDESPEPVCIRFEAAGELCQKFLMAMLELGLKPGQVFDLAVEAVDPAIDRNAKAGKKVAEPGLYVNHNLTLAVNGKSHTGHPPKGQRFVQKPTIEFMETLFKQALFGYESTR